MARGRIISPDFWTDSTMIGLSAFARLFYIGSWNFTYCDKGHLPDDPMGLKLKILPSDQVDVGEILAELMSAGRITRIVIAGKSFLFIPTFETYQSSTADKRWSTRCPACKLLETPESLPVLSKTPANSAWSGVEGSGSEAIGVEDARSAPAPSRTCPKHPEGTDKPCRACKEARERYEAAQVATPTPKAGRVCEHGRPVGTECPHCEGQVAA